MRTTAAGTPSVELALDRVRLALQDLHFGTITLIVHNGVVVQIDRTERQRLDQVTSRS